MNPTRNAFLVRILFDELIEYQVILYENENILVGMVVRAIQIHGLACDVLRISRPAYLLIEFGRTVET